MPLYGVGHRFPTRCIDLAHRPDVGTEVARIHEAGQRQLGDLRGVAVEDAARMAHGFDQLVRQHHVTHPQTGIQ
ncbi:hypothetical protein D9M69_661300 [compost metagenome]